ncbi:hypothetical protein FNV43_RR21035 [Rhamnella rubrinervis]|uniref:Uncharacterized protein n=1 Tax=Rhamnella rubrinervis TaxID=2594499 RepID=A0A8K0E2B2_9ROSA|nr:hypothetical protein FNV43_RR21035 [Rhamnella rubrinervis]
MHSSDTAIDEEKDLIELELAKLCLEKGIPYLGICRGSHMLNVASGGTLYQDLGTQLSNTYPRNPRSVTHIDYSNYDGHRHALELVENTPLHHWFKDSLGHENMEIWKLANRFVPMAFAPDGLVEGFYDPNAYDPEEGKFLMGLQFHPEQMRKLDSHDFDYPGCSRVYQEFINATIAYQKKVNSSICQSL